MLMTNATSECNRSTISTFLSLTLSILEQDSDRGRCLSPADALLEDPWWPPPPPPVAWEGRMEEECRFRVEVAA